MMCLFARMGHFVAARRRLAKGRRRRDFREPPSGGVRFLFGKRGVLPDRSCGEQPYLLLLQPTANPCEQVRPYGLAWRPGLRS